jgi:DNA-directed RNA polymerase subunit RPC12/RpoP
MKRLIRILFLSLLGMSWTMLVRAQGEAELILSVNRDVGYSSGTGRIQGAFTMRVSGPDNLQRVVFLIDGQSIGEDTQAPFSIQFHTGDFSLGVHTMSAVGTTSDGHELRSNETRREFVSAEEGWQTGMKIAFPIIGIAFGAMLLSFLLPAVLGRGKRRVVPAGAPRSYGMLGGTICSKCGRPFGIHVWGLNMVVGKLDRCPYCGKWSVVRRVPMEALKAAEAAELDMAEGSDSALAYSSEDALRKELDESRFLDL